MVQEVVRVEVAHHVGDRLLRMPIHVVLIEHRAHVSAAAAAFVVAPHGIQVELAKKFVRV